MADQHETQAALQPLPEEDTIPIADGSIILEIDDFGGYHVMLSGKTKVVSDYQMAVLASTARCRFDPRFAAKQIAWYHKTYPKEEQN